MRNNFETELKMSFPQMSTGSRAMQYRTRFVAIITIGSLVAIGTFFLPLPNAYCKPKVQEVLRDVVNEQLACKFPLLNPFDPSIVEYIKYEKSYNCGYIQPYLTYVDFQNYLHFNKSEYLKLLDNTNGTILCKYSTYDRSKGPNDDLITFDTGKVMKLGRKYAIRKDFVNVSCIAYGNYSDVRYYNNHAIVSNVSKKFKMESEDQLSVLIFYTDSVSRSAFIRYLPKSLHYLTKVMSGTVFKGYNKAAGASFGNAIPVLTGKRVYDGEPNMTRDFTVDYQEVFFDDWPLIWRNYSKKGYATLFVEDCPHWGLFNMLAKGFKVKPNDHNYRPYFNHWKSVPLNNVSKYFCFGNVPEVQTQLDILTRAFYSYANRLKWLYNFVVKIAHDEDEWLGPADQIYLKFFKDLHTGGYLNKTAIVMMSDHGHRFSKIRSTIVGRFEENLPFSSLILPQWFLQKHSHIKRSLEVNKMRLTSNFDVHETLLDILNSNFNGTQRAVGSRGFSQLYDIPANRTCIDAGISREYCTCHQSEPIDINSTLVAETAAFLVDETNELLKDLHHLCVPLEFHKVLRVELFTAAEHLNKEEDEKIMLNSTKLIQITIEVAPSKGELDAMVEYISDRSEFKLQGGIERVNAYRGQSDCIDDRLLRKYCYCRDMSKKLFIT